MPSVSISVVIPIIPKHNRYLHDLVLSIAAGSAKPAEIIVSASSQTPESCTFLNRIASYSPVPMKVITSALSFPPGINRNNGWEIATADYVTFCDADDTYSRKRLEILQDIAIATNADLILHNYARLKPNWYLESLPVSSELLDERSLFESTFPDGYRDISTELGISGDTNILLPVGVSKSWRIPHGHATVKRTLGIRYGTKFSGEDGQFCRDVLYSGHKVVYSPTKLSNYDRPTINNMLQMSSSRIHADLAQTKYRLFEKLKRNN